MKKNHKKILLLNAVFSYFLASGLTGFLASGPFTDQENDNQLFYLGMAGYLIALFVVGYALYKRTEFWRTLGVIACWTFPVVGLGIAFVLSVAIDVL